MLINKNFNSQRVKSSWREILVQNLNTSKVAYSHLLWGFTFKRRLQCIRKIHVQYAFQMKLIIWWVKNNNFLFVIFHRLYIYKKDCLKPSIKKVHLYTFTVCFSDVTNHLIGQKCDIFYIIFHSDCMYSMLTKKRDHNITWTVCFSDDVSKICFTYWSFWQWLFVEIMHKKYMSSMFFRCH